MPGGAVFILCRLQSSSVVLNFTVCFSCRWFPRHRYGWSIVRKVGWNKGRERQAKVGLGSDSMLFTFISTSTSRENVSCMLADRESSGQDVTQLTNRATRNISVPGNASPRYSCDSRTVQFLDSNVGSWVIALPFFKPISVKDNSPTMVSWLDLSRTTLQDEMSTNSFQAGCSNWEICIRYFGVSRLRNIPFGSLSHYAGDASFVRMMFSLTTPDN